MEGLRNRPNVLLKRVPVPHPTQYQRWLPHLLSIGCQSWTKHSFENYYCSPDGCFEDYYFWPDGSFENYYFSPDGSFENYYFSPDGSFENYYFSPDGKAAVCSIIQRRTTLLSRMVLMSLGILSKTNSSSKTPSFKNCCRVGINFSTFLP